MVDFESEIVSEIGSGGEERTHVAQQTTEATDELEVWIDQDLCTGDGLCVQYAPEVFEFDVDGLAYVKTAAGDLLAAPGQRADVPAALRLDVINSAKECPGECIHVMRAGQDIEVAGPDA